MQCEAQPFSLQVLGLLATWMEAAGCDNRPSTCVRFISSGLLPLHTSCPSSFTEEAIAVSSLMEQHRDSHGIPATWLPVIQRVFGIVSAPPACKVIRSFCPAPGLLRHLQFRAVICLAAQGPHDGSRQARVGLCVPVSHFTGAKRQKRTSRASCAIDGQAHHLCAKWHARTGQPSECLPWRHHTWTRRQHGVPAAGWGLYCRSPAGSCRLDPADVLVFSCLQNAQACKACLRPESMLKTCGLKGYPHGPDWLQRKNEDLLSKWLQRSDVQHEVSGEQCIILSMCIFSSWLG